MEPGEFRRFFIRLTNLSWIFLLVALCRKRSRKALSDYLCRSWEMVLFFIVTCMALLYMAGVTKLAINEYALNTRYGIMGLPVLATILLAGAFSLSKRVALVLTLGYAALSSAVFYAMTYVDLLPYQTQADGISEMFKAARDFHPLLHPTFPETLTLEAFFLGILVLLLPVLVCPRKVDE